MDATSPGRLQKSVITSIEAKSGLTRASLPETFLTSLYRCLAAYRGCGHGCVYCDGRAEKYYVEGDFESDIACRDNLPQLLEQEIAAGAAQKEWGAVAIGSGVTDVYQPLEQGTLLTRRTLEVLSTAGLPLVILTKNAGILRDFDILSRFPRVLLICTITTLDPLLARILEPGASAPQERLDTLVAAKAAGFHTGVMAMPLCPAISDSPDQSTALFEAIKATGAGFVQPGGLTLRPGRQKDLFLSVVREHWPHLIPVYGELYGENRASGMPLNIRAVPAMQGWIKQIRSLGMAPLIPQSIHRTLLSPPDSLFVLLNHMQELYSQGGIDTGPLRAASTRYTQWLSEQRTHLRRKRLPVFSGDPYPVTRVLTALLRETCSKNNGTGFVDICGNTRLARLVHEVLCEDRIFDYASLKIC